MEGLGGKVVETNAAWKREREICHFREGGGEELFIPRFGCIPGCLALILTASCFFFFLSYLQTDWTLELPSPCLIRTFRSSVTMAPPDVCSWLKKGQKSVTRVSFSASLLPLPVRQKASSWIGWNLERHTHVDLFSHVTCLRAGGQDGVRFFFPSAQAPELLWKSLSGNWTHFFVPVEVGRDWKHSLWDNRLSKTPVTPPCSSQTWIRQQQVTQQLLQRFACRRTLSMVSQPEFRATPLCLNLNIIWWSVSWWQSNRGALRQNKKCTFHVHWKDFDLKCYLMSNSAYSKDKI